MSILFGLLEGSEMVVTGVHGCMEDEKLHNERSIIFPELVQHILTGQCKYGAACLFNHPANRTMAIAPRMKGEFPERMGQPECRHYIKTGFCKFGATCKFNHTGIDGRVALNVLGYPLRPDVIECAYYMRNGECKYGAVCIYNHPLPIGNDYFGLAGSSVCPPVVRSPASAELSFPVARPPSHFPSPQWPQNSPDYAPLGIPQGVTPAPGWNPFNVNVVPSTGILPMASNGLTNGTLHTEAPNFGGAPFRPGFLPPNCYVFPERPGQPECQYYLKTGECKFGIVCKYHHPKERCLPVPNCVLSPKGLPLRPGELLCVFYSRFGSCKYGASCKYDHPMEAYGSSSATEITTVVSSSSSESVALNSSQDGLVEEGPTKDLKKLLRLSEATEKPNGDNAIGSQ